LSLNRVHRLISSAAFLLLSYYSVAGTERNSDNFQSTKPPLEKGYLSPLRGDFPAVSPGETLKVGFGFCTDLVSCTIIKDSLKRAINRDANRASLMSAILPGLGQVYNRKYWKVPVIYAAIGGIGYFARGLNNEYQNYHNELLYRYANDQQVNTFPEYTTDNLISLKNQAKKYRDMCFIGMGIFYVLNIIDANVDAHLKKFDVSDDLSLSIAPKTFYCLQGPGNAGAGISLALHFK